MNSSSATYATDSKVRTQIYIFLFFSTLIWGPHLAMFRAFDPVLRGHPGRAGEVGAHMQCQESTPGWLHARPALYPLYFLPLPLENFLTSQFVLLPSEIQPHTVASPLLTFGVNFILASTSQCFIYKVRATNSTLQHFQEGKRPRWALKQLLRAASLLCCF